MSLKICTKCNKEKDVEEFYKNKKWCKLCSSKHHKIWYKKNKNKVINKQKERYKNNKEYLINYQKEYRIKNKLKRSKRRKLYAEKNKMYLKYKAYLWGKSKSLYNTYVYQISWCEKVRRDPKNEDYLQVKCTNCSEWFNPSNFEVSCRIRAINSNEGRENRFYCSEACKQSCSIFGQQMYPKDNKPYYYRSEQADWAYLIKERDKECIKCDSTERLEAHHINGLNENIYLAWDLDAGITLCHDCHKEAHKEIGCRYIDLKKDQLCK